MIKGYLGWFDEKPQTEEKENTFIKTSYPLKRMMNYWRNKSSNEDKGGSFNLELYLAYLETINQQ